MELDAQGWVMAEAEEDVGSDAEWVLTDWHGEDERVRCASGVFFRAAQRSAFAPFDERARAAVRDPPLQFLPPSAYPSCSAGGLLLLHGPWSAYYVTNPATAAWAALPRPPRSRSRQPALALVPRRTNYFVISAIGTVNPNAYSFDVFSSATGEWRASAAEARPAGSVVSGSGVAAGGTAYWRTQGGFVLAYDPEADSAWTVAAPCGPGDLWQLGEAGGRLCCARVAGPGVEMSALGPAGEWEMVGSFKLVEAEEAEAWCREPPRPLRFQGADPEALLLLGSKVVRVDMSTETVRELELGGDVTGLAPEDYVAHINTLATVHRHAKS